MNKIGKVVNTHGIRGEVRVFLTSFDMYDQLSDVKEVIIDKKIFELESFRKHKKFTLMKFKGFDNINDVLDLKNKNVFLDEEEQVFLHQTLVGYKVINSKGKELGVVQEVIYNNAHGVADLGELLFPLVDKFVLTIDEKQKTIITTYFDEVPDED